MRVIPIGNYYNNLMIVVLNVSPSVNPILQQGIVYSSLNKGIDDDNWSRSFDSIEF